ncbi:MAG: D-alanyl-D-alanine carboxypeptidase [Steroidobacteraceae bacterium]|nr:D-alanyl-D-alanine carboxypeptidase [Steroidobacteraceae bacterium]MCC7198909.1 D-alanyl-D-alanine carboxypeptidase [Gammaproteobacteria bacterium]
MAATPVPPPPELPAKGWILIDSHSGRVITSRNADERLEPASLTKLMTGYAVFHALQSGKMKLSDSVPISEHAWRAEGSRTFVEVGTRVPVETLIQGMIVQSGNDATIALAEAVAGTEPTFAALMNQYAARLGMTNSSFENAAGLPGARHYVSARDMATLARAVISEFPQYYHWYSQKEFAWGGITQGNRNGLLTRDPSVDGMKTGHTETAGYCLVSSAQRDGMRLISVVMGTASPKVREDASLALLNYGFNFFETKRALARGRALATPRIYGADGGEAALGLREDLYVTVPRGEYGNVRIAIEFKPGLQAPLKASDAVGKVSALLDGKIVAERTLYPVKDVAEGGFFRRAWDTVASWFA